MTAVVTWLSASTCLSFLSCPMVAVAMVVQGSLSGLLKNYVIHPVHPPWSHSLCALLRLVSYLLSEPLCSPGTPIPHTFIHPVEGANSTQQGVGRKTRGIGRKSSPFFQPSGNMRFWGALTSGYSTPRASLGPCILVVLKLAHILK